MKLLTRAVGAIAIGAAVSGPAVIAAGAAATAQTSRTFAGYQLTGAKIATAASRFAVPTITCKKAFSGITPGVVISTKPKNGGFTQSGAGVAVQCQSGAADYQAQVKVNGTVYPAYAVAPRDRMAVSVAISAKKSVVVITDLTSGSSKRLRGSGNVGQTVEIGAESISLATSAAIEPFAKTIFSAAKVDAKAIGTFAPTAVERVDGKKVQISVSKLGAKKRFALTFKASK